MSVLVENIPVQFILTHDKGYAIFDGQDPTPGFKSASTSFKMLTDCEFYSLPVFSMEYGDATCFFLLKYNCYVEHITRKVNEEGIYDEIQVRHFSTNNEIGA